MFEAKDNLEGVPYFKVDVKNVTDSSLIILNNSKHLIGIMFVPKNSYIVVDDVLNNGTFSFDKTLLWNNTRLRPLS